MLHFSLNINSIKSILRVHIIDYQLWCDNSEVLKHIIFDIADQFVVVESIISWY